MSNGRRVALAGTFVVLASPTIFAAHPAARILHHESVSIAVRQSGATEHVSFEGFGKHFDLTLEPNERVRRALKAGDLNEIVPLRGTIDGLPHSWVRLTRNASGEWRGMLSDGQEIYAIEPASDVQSMTVESVETAHSAPVIYRLKDLIVQWAPGFCEALPPGGKTNALETFKALGAEALQAEAASGAPTRQVSIGVVGDYEFKTYFVNPLQTPTQAVIERMNIVDGIFSNQVGVDIEVPTIKIFETSSDPFTNAEAKVLLDEVRAYRRSDAEQSMRALTHLMTGRDLNGDTVGIGYTGTVCEGEYAESLSEGTRSTTMSALIAAHEIGHNFNAPHDGESPGACATTPTTYLMASQINYSDQFSACSLKQIQAKIATAPAQCLTAYSPANAAIEVASSAVQGTPNTALPVPFVIRSTGGTAVQNVSVTASLPSGLTLNSTAASDGTTCTTGAGSVSCIFGEMEAAATRTVTLNVASANTGTFPVNISLEATHDAVASDNSGQINVTIAASAASPPVTASSGGGGGGAMSLETLAALLGLMMWRARSWAMSGRKP